MGHMYDPSKSPEENKKEALEDAGPSIPKFGTKVPQKQLKRMVKKYLRGKEQERKMRELAGRIDAALAEGKLQETEIDEVLSKLEKEIKQHQYSFDTPIKETLKQLRKIKSHLRHFQRHQ